MECEGGECISYYDFGTEKTTPQVNALAVTEPSMDSLFNPILVDISSTKSGRSVMITLALYHQENNKN